MDDATGHESRPGGTVMPIRRVTAGEPEAPRAGPPQEPPGRHYELYDPCNDAKYYARTFDEMVANAERAGSVGFYAVDADGTRTHVLKVDGQWQRPGPVQPSRQQSRGDAADIADVGDVAGEAARTPVGRATGGRDNGPAVASAGRTPPSTTRQDAQPSNADAEAHRAAQQARLEAELNERYIIRRALLRVGNLQVGQTEYRYRGDNARVAFTESPSRLATDTNNPSVARSMVDVAQARNWQALRVSGNEDFKRLVWLEASVRNVKTVGYEPLPGDLELLRKAREARQVNRIEPIPDPASRGGGATAGKQSARGGGGRKAVLAALEAVLIDRKVPMKQRQAVMAAAAEGLARRQAAGQTHKVKVYDAAAPSRRPPVVPTPEMQRARDRTAPAPTR